MKVTDVIQNVSARHRKLIKILFERADIWRCLPFFINE